MNWIIGNYIFGFFGALARWLFHSLKRIFQSRKKKISFMNIWLGANSDSSEIDDLSNNFVNVVLGIIIFVIIADIFIRLGY